MARFAVAALVLAFAASAFAACFPSGATYFGGATSVQAQRTRSSAPTAPMAATPPSAIGAVSAEDLVLQGLDGGGTTEVGGAGGGAGSEGGGSEGQDQGGDGEAGHGAWDGGCWGRESSGAGYAGFKANTYQVAASDAAMTTAQESGLGFSKLTVPQGLQTYSVLFNGATELTLSCQSLANLYSGFSKSIGGGAITILVARSDSSGTTFVFTSYLNLCTAAGARPWPSSKVGESGIAWGSTALVSQSGSSGVASYVFSHPGAIGYLGNPVELWLYLPKGDFKI
eukprot:SM000144S00699  [mRNA]  locus=s144:248114:249473:- [translate_table: standard]